MQTLFLFSCLLGGILLSRRNIMLARLVFDLMKESNTNQFSTHTSWFTSVYSARWFQSVRSIFIVVHYLLFTFLVDTTTLVVLTLNARLTSFWTPNFPVWFIVYVVNGEWFSYKTLNISCSISKLVFLFYFQSLTMSLEVWLRECFWGNIS